MASNIIDPFDTPPAPSGIVDPYDMPPQETTLGEDIWQGVKDLAGGAARGAASLGATVIAPFQAAVAGTGQTGAQSQRQQTLKKLEDALKYFGVDTDSGAYQIGKVGTEVAGTAGVGTPIAAVARGIAPGAVNLAKAIETMGASGGGLGTRMAGGAVSGAGMSAAISPEDAGFGAAMGAGVPVVGRLLSAGTRGIGTLYDAVRGDLGAIKAGQLMRDAAGSRIGAIEAANRASVGQDITAAQAAAGADADVYQALMKQGEHFDPNSYFRLLKERQAADRMAALQGVTPDLAAAEAARDAATRANYADAFMDTRRLKTKGDPDLAEIANNPYVMRAYNKVKDVIDVKGLDPYKNTTEYLHHIKMGLDDLLKARGDSALADTERQAVVSVKNALVDWLKNKNAAYDFARTEHARLSAPINQAKVLEQMQGVLRREGGGERVQPFLDVMGRGENALLKRADQNPRFGGIEDVLTSQQMAVRGDIAAQLIRDKAVAEQAAAGSGGLDMLFQKDMSKLRLPSYLSVIASTTNKALDELEKTISRRTIETLVEAAKSGANANEIMKILPKHERNKAMNWVYQGGLNRYLGAAGAAVGAQ